MRALTPEAATGYGVPSFCHSVPRAMSQNASRHRPNLPGAYVLLLVDVVARWNVSSDQLLDGSGLTPDTIRDPLSRISLEDYNRILKRALELTNEPGLGFYIGMQMKLSSHGFIGFAAMTAKNLREALDIAQRYIRVRSSAISLRLEENGDTALLYIDQAMPNYFLGEVAIFALLVGIAQMGATAVGQPLSGSADTRFEKPAYYERFMHLLGGTVHFNQPYNRIVFPAQYLDLPLVMADPVATQLAREQCERELMALGDSNSFIQQVRGLIYDEQHGFRSVEGVAERLHMSERTLKRQLSQQGTTYSDILEDLRHQKSLLLLENRDISIERVAEQLGYSDVANFTRAFKRWTGQTPSMYRKGK